MPAEAGAPNAATALGWDPASRETHWLDSGVRRNDEKRTHRGWFPFSHRGLPRIYRLARLRMSVSSMLIATVLWPPCGTITSA